MKRKYISKNSEMAKKIPVDAKQTPVPLLAYSKNPVSSSGCTANPVSNQSCNKTYK